MTIEQEMRLYNASNVRAMRRMAAFDKIRAIEANGYDFEPWKSDTVMPRSIYKELNEIEFLGKTCAGETKFYDDEFCRNREKIEAMTAPNPFYTVEELQSMQKGRLANVNKWRRLEQMCLEAYNQLYKIYVQRCQLWGVRTAAPSYESIYMTRDEWFAERNEAARNRLEKGFK